MRTNILIILENEYSTIFVVDVLSRIYQEIELKLVNGHTAEISGKNIKLLYLNKLKDEVVEVVHNINPMKIIFIVESDSNYGIVENISWPGRKYEVKTFLSDYVARKFSLDKKNSINGSDINCKMLEIYFSIKSRKTPYCFVSVGNNC